MKNTENVKEIVQIIEAKLRSTNDLQFIDKIETYSDYRRFLAHVNQSMHKLSKRPEISKNADEEEIEKFVENRKIFNRLLTLLELDENSDKIRTSKLTAYFAESTKETFKHVFERHEQDVKNLIVDELDADLNADVAYSILQNWDLSGAKAYIDEVNAAYEKVSSMLVK